MGHRPAPAEVTPAEQLSRPAELVQRAKQLAQLANYQFGRNPMSGISPLAPAQPATPVPATPKPLARPEPARTAVTNRVAELGLDVPEMDDTITGLRITPSFDTGGTAVLTPATAARPRADAKPRPAVQIGPRPAVQAEPRAEPRTDAFYGVRQLTDGVIFAARFDGAARVLIAGDFNNWSAMSTPMAPAPGQPGLWQAKLPLLSGRYRYRFVVDGRWTTDPYNGAVETNQFGEMNNVVEVA